MPNTPICRAQCRACRKIVRLLHAHHSQLACPHCGARTVPNPWTLTGTESALRILAHVRHARPWSPGHRCNSEACATATGKTCHCKCGGAGHGKDW